MLSADFSSLLEMLRSWGKPMSMASNGQAMGPQVRRAMLGMDVELYISIDAGTDEGYRRYRNERFAEVVENVRALCREKREHRNLPNVIVTYIAMRSNRPEVDAFLALNEGRWCGRGTDHEFGSPLAFEGSNGRHTMASASCTGTRH